MNVLCYVIGRSDQLERKGSFCKDSEENDTEEDNSESVQDHMACTWRARWSGEESKENVWKGGGKNLEGDLKKCLSIIFK